MSQIAVGNTGAFHGDEHAEHVLARREIDPAAMTLPAGAGRVTSLAFFSAGLLAIGLTIVGSMLAGEHVKAHAMASYHMGFMYALGACLGCLGLTMILQQFNAGWSAPVRRQAENIASVIWFVGLLFIPIVLLEVIVFRDHPKLFHWLSPALTDPASPEYDIFAVKKQGYLNAPFWIFRAIAFFALWTYLARRLLKLSREQDVTGDKWLTAKARNISSYGLLLFALTAAFASFDWLMSLDFHWFSTMFGVWFFAGSTRACIALTIVVLCLMKLRGKLGNAYTTEHMHDSGKLLFAFTVFWAYITFCQYFLIWYSNIPEETAFYNVRVADKWQPFPMIMIIMNFVVPFLLLLFRDLKRNPRTLMAIALWVLVAYALDIYFIVRPMIKGVGFGENAWLDVVGMLGPICLFLGMVVRKVAANPLIPLKDPRLHEVLAHKNYV